LITVEGPKRDHRAARKRRARELTSPEGTQVKPEAEKSLPILVIPAKAGIQLQ